MFKVDDNFIEEDGQLVGLFLTNKKPLASKYAATTVACLNNLSELKEIRSKLMLYVAEQEAPYDMELVKLLNRLSATIDRME